MSTVPTPPRRADVLVLDLVRQYGTESYLTGCAERHDEAATGEHDDNARTLFARIATLLPQQPVQARTKSGDPIWQHIPCGWPHPWHPDAEPDTGPDGDPTGCHKPGPWRPLLVGGTPAPEVTDRQYADEFRRIGESEAPILAAEVAEQHHANLIAQVMAELGVNRYGDVLDALAEERNALTEVKGERNAIRRERDEARVEVERLQAEVTIERQAEERANAELVETVKRLDDAEVDSGGVSERVGYAVQSMQHGWSTARELQARLDTVKSDRETVRGSLAYLKDTVTRPAIKALGVQHNEDIVPAIERLKDRVGELVLTVQQAEQAADEWAGTARARGVEVEHLKAMLVEIAPAPADPLVLSLPEVDPRTVALIGKDRHVPEGNLLWWRSEPAGRVRHLGTLLAEESDGVRVELAPPREPRTWSRRPLVEDPPDDLRAVKAGGTGEVYRRDANNPDRWVSGRGVAERWELLREVDLTEVLDDDQG